MKKWKQKEKKQKIKKFKKMLFEKGDEIKIELKKQNEWRIRICFLYLQKKLN